MKMSMYGYKDEVCTEYVYVLHGSWAHNIMATHNQVTGRANEQDSPLSMTYHAGGHAALLLVCTDIAMCIHTESVAMPKTKAMGNTMFTCGRAFIQLFVLKKWNLRFKSSGTCSCSYLNQPASKPNLWELAWIYA